MLSAVIVFYLFALTVSLLHLAVSAVITRKRMKGNAMATGEEREAKLPRISIFKPLKGLDDALEENLRSYFELDYPDFELIFGLTGSGDQSFDVISKLALEYKLVDTKIVVNDFAVGLNPKINNLYNMDAYATGSYLLISDSNTRVAPEFLKQMISAIAAPEVGLVTATIRGVGAKQFAAIMENLHINSYISPNVFVADSLSGIPVVIGKSILISRSLLSKMGGFAAFKNYLAEDYLLGLRAKELGYRVKTIPTLVDNVNINWSLKRFLNRHTRWAKIRRNMHLHHYLIESFSNPVALASILMLLLRNAIAMELLVGIMMVKILHDRYVSGLLDSDFRWYHYALVPAKDLLISVLWLIPFFSYKINWRENLLRIGRASQLQSIPSLK